MKLSPFTKIVIAGGALTTLAIANISIFLIDSRYRDMGGQSYTDKPCGDLVAHPYELVDGQYTAHIRVAYKDGIRPFAFTWPVAREDLTRAVERAIIDQAQERMMMRTGSYALLSVMRENGPLGWLEVTCEEGKEPCQAKALRSTCWGD